MPRFINGDLSLKFTAKFHSSVGNSGVAIAFVAGVDSELFVPLSQCCTPSNKETIHVVHSQRRKKNTLLPGADH